MEGALMAFDDYRPAWAVKGLTAPERLVLLALAEHRHGEHDEDYNLCCPGYTLLEEETGLSRPSISKAMKGLREKVPLGVTTDPKNRRSNRYTFPWNQTRGECSPNEPSVPLLNTPFPNGTPYSPNERSIPQVNSNKEANQEVKQGSELRTQQPVVPTESAAVCVASYKPVDSEASRLACLFSEVLGKVGNLQPEKEPREWVSEFSKILPTWGEALESDIRFIQLHPRWRERFKAAEHPVAYLKKTLEHIEGERIRYEAKRDSSRPPASAQPPRDVPTLPDDKVREAIAELRSGGRPPEMGKDAENPDVIVEGLE
jgi:hypothetical protein